MVIQDPLTNQHRLRITQLAATAGDYVNVFDADPARLRRSQAEIEASLAKLVARGLLDHDSAAGALTRLTLCSSVAEAADGADLVIEAVVERLDVKQAILAAREHQTRLTRAFSGRPARGM